VKIEETESAERNIRTARNGRREVEPKVSKQEQILATAAKLFNAQGVGAVGLADLSKALGLSRATVYHYVADREDLVFRCYQRSCAAETEWLDRAEVASPGLPRVLRYLEECLSEEAKQTAVITDIGLLSKGPREIITRDIRRNYERLAAMIGEGIRLGNIRPCDEQLIARVLPSMVAFYRVSGQWVEAERDIENVAAILDFVARGSAMDRDTPFELHQSVDMFSPLQVLGLDTLSVADLRIEQVLMAGSKLINLRGAEGLSLEDVVGALGVTRGTVYHYFSNREDLIRGCLERGYKLYDAFIEYAERHGRTGLEKSLIITHLNVQAQAGSMQPVAAWMGGEVLDPRLRATFADRLRKLLERSDAVAVEGITDGSRREVDYRPITIARAGAYLWIPKWIDQLDNSKPHQIADEIVSFFKSGLAV
jgi:AcrR family transcriptional regulator